MTSEGKSAEFSSQEGTTQGCPLAMAMFAIALKPLHDEVRSLCMLMMEPAVTPSPTCVNSMM